MAYQPKLFYNFVILWLVLPKWSIFYNFFLLPNVILNQLTPANFLLRLNYGWVSHLYITISKYSNLYPNLRDITQTWSQGFRVGCVMCKTHYIWLILLKSFLKYKTSPKTKINLQLIFYTKIINFLTNIL